MNRNNYLRLAAAAVVAVVVLGLLGVPVVRYAPFALILLVCPLMMFFMMRGMGHGSGSSRDDASGHAEHQPPPAPPVRQPR